MANIGGPIDNCTSKVYSSYIKRPANRNEFFLTNMWGSDDYFTTL